MTRHGAEEIKEKPFREAAAVKTADRTLDVFEAFAAAGGPLSLTELAERIKAPLSSCHALLRTLQARGYVYVVDQRRSFYPSKRMFEVTTAIAKRDPLIARLAQVMTELRDTIGETIIVGKRSGNEVIYLEVIEGTQLIRYREHAGSKKPFHSSAIGKAVLGSLPKEELDALMRRGRLRAMTERTITDADVLRAELDDSRARGFYRTRGENVPDVQAISMPVRIHGEILAMAIAGPIDRMRHREERYAAALRSVVAKVEEQSGAPA